MSPEQELLTKWRSLPKDKQEEVLNFVEFIQAKMVKPQPIIPENKSQLGKRLRQIRAEIVDSGEHLLTQDELEKEMANRRGGLQEIDT
jgi:RecA/RadA recombinase